MTDQAAITAAQAAYDEAVRNARAAYQAELAAITADHDRALADAARVREDSIIQAGDRLDVASLAARADYDAAVAAAIGGS